MIVVCIDNKGRVKTDSSSDRADEYLTVGKTYKVSNTSLSGKYYFIENSDKGGFPYGHRWWQSDRFDTLENFREKKISLVL